MHSRNPSYVTKNRLGVYYLQLRIPKEIRDNRPDLKSLVRKSLKTRNRREALRIARKLVVWMEDNDYQKDPLDWEEEARKHDQLFHIGIPLFEELEQLLKEHDQIALDDFLIRHTSNSDDPKEKTPLEYMLELNNLYVDQFEHLLSEGNREETTRFIQNLPKVFKPNINDLIRQRLARKSNNSKTATITPSPDMAGMENRIHESIKNQHKANLISIPLTEAFDIFITERKEGWKKYSKMEGEYRNSIFATFQELVGDIETADLTKEHSIRYKKYVLKAPTDRSKMPQYRKLTVRQIEKMDIPEKDKFSTRNKNKYLQRLSGFLRWLQKDGYAAADIQDPLIIKSGSNNNTPAHADKAIYGCEDLTKLFNSRHYRDGKFELAFKFWTPLIALYSGARENEIAQLFIDDIYQHEETGIWVFDFNQDDAERTLKSIKKDEHARIVPIHKQLLDLDFIEFFELMKNKGEERLFPECPHCGVNQYGDKVQRWFNNTYTNKVNCNITTPKTSFHSFRHTLITHLGNKLEIPPHKISVLVGQKPDGGVTVSRYIKPHELKDRDNFLQKVDFSDCIDFSRSGIRPWKYHKFAKK